jgi:hypothetical protein
LSAGNVVAPLTDGKMIGDEISFTAGGTLYSGRVKGEEIVGTSRSAAGSPTPWQAARVAK